MWFLADLPEHVRESLHYDSYVAFPAVRLLVFRHWPRRLLNIGGKTAKWVQARIGHDAVVPGTWPDQAARLNMANTQLPAAGASRVSVVCRHKPEAPT